MAKTERLRVDLGTSPSILGARAPSLALSIGVALRAGGARVPSHESRLSLKLAHYLLRTILKELLLNFRMKQDGKRRLGRFRF